ncbi:MAG: 6-hydroxymethylpterin diphosphokinase MptE-like protein [Thermoplasmata archaeon]
MEYATWAPLYAQIAAEFGFSFDREERSADRLVALLSPGARSEPLDRIRARLLGRTVVVVGSAPRGGPPPLWRLPARDPAPVVIAADPATAACLDAGIVPELIVTDLDGPIPTEIGANRRGSLVVVHAHGDNRSAVEEWVPQFPGELAGSWAGPPRPSLLNVGGFTDGDRAVFLADHVGASEVLLWGFDFATVDEADPTLRARKLAKLSWARRLIAEVAKTGRTAVRVWGRDGSLLPYPAGSSVASTR